MSSCGCIYATGLSDAPPVEVDEYEQIEIVPWPLAEIDNAIAAVPGREVADRAAVARAAARPRPLTLAVRVTDRP